MRRLLRKQWNPVAGGMALFFAIVAASLMLVRVAIDGGQPTVALLQVLAVAATVAGLALAGARPGPAGGRLDRGTMDITRAGLPARA